MPSTNTRSPAAVSLLLLGGITTFLLLGGAPDRAAPAPGHGVRRDTPIRGPMLSADTLRGSGAADVLRGSGIADLLEGGDGDDHLVGYGGADVLRGGNGDDVLEGGDGADVLEGGEGDDQLLGGDDRDFLFGEGGNDVLKGGNGPDVIDGGEGNDQLDGGDGDDMLDGREGEDVLRGGPGRDVLDGHDGNDFLDGGPGNDNLDGGDEDDILNGGAGADSLSGGDGSDVLDGGNDNDLLLGNDGADVLRGGNGNDQLAGGDGPDYLDGDRGDDLLNGGEGDDVLIGGGGNDTLFAYLGDDKLDGGPGDDLLRGSEGDDAISGGPGDDVITGGWGTDPTSAGPGNDRIEIRAGDVDSLGIEIIDGGINSDTARVEADTLLLEGFHATDVTPLDLGGPSGWRIKDPITGGVYVVTGVEYVVYATSIPYIAGETATLLLINPSSTDRAVGVLEFVGLNGDSAVMSVNGAPESRRSEFDFPPLGSIELALAGPPGGGVRIVGSQPVAGVLDTPAAEGLPSRMTTATFGGVYFAPIHLDRNQGISTGLAVRNQVSATALKLETSTLRGAEGDSREVSIGSSGATVLTLDQLYPGVPQFEGRLLMRGGPVAVMAFEAGPKGTIPTAVLQVTPSRDQGPLVIPHLTAGDGHQTVIRLTAVTPDSLKGGVISFFDRQGNPLELDLVGVGRVTEAAFRTRAVNTATFITSDAGTFVEGSAIITATSGRPGGAVRWTLPGAGQVEQAIGTMHQRFVAPVRRANGTTSHVALSAGENPVTVRLVLHDADGRPRRSGETSVRLPAAGSVYRSLDQLFPRAVLEGWRGVLVAEVDGGTAAAMVLDVGATAASPVPLTPFDSPE